MKNSMYNSDQYVFVKTVLSCYNVLLHIVLGMIIGISLLFAVKMDYNVTTVSEDIILLHILLCVPGFILLTSEALMAMTSYNTWSSSLSKKNKIRAHWFLQVLSSGLGLTGCIIIMIYKNGNFDTLHGRFGLVTLILTMVNIILGILSLFSDNLRRYVPPMVFKMTHIVLGIVTFASASACLCYAFNKDIFILWTNDNVSLGVVAITGIFTIIILINPLVTLGKKIVKIVKTRMEK